jgi:FkbM family methyltransferase
LIGHPLEKRRSITRVDRISQHTFLRDFVVAQSVVVDLGANEGEFCTVIARRYGCRVFAAEPTPHLYEALRNASPRVTLFPVALGGSDGSATFRFDPGKSKSGSLLAHRVTESVLSNPVSTKCAQVDVWSLKGLFERTGLLSVDLLKVDIEGAELDLFESASSDCLLRCRQIAVEFHDYWYPELSERTEAVKRKLVGIGFEMIQFTPNNKDVLFFRRDAFTFTSAERWYLAHVIRNANGFGRMVREAIRRCGRQLSLWRTAS